MYISRSCRKREREKESVWGKIANAKGLQPSYRRCTGRQNIIAWPSLLKVRCSLQVEGGKQSFTKNYVST